MTSTPVLRLALTSFHYLGVNAFFRRLNESKLLVLYFHGICDDSFPVLPQMATRQLPVACFVRDLAYLRRRGYCFVTLTEAIQAIREPDKAGKRLVCLTFDDGLRNVLRNAYPAMKRYGAKGCFYVATDFIGSDRAMPVDWVRCATLLGKERVVELPFNGELLRLDLRTPVGRTEACSILLRRLKAADVQTQNKCVEQWNQILDVEPHHEFKMVSWSDLREVDPEVLEIGSHTCTHGNLSRMQPDEALREIRDSKRIIERNTGRQVEHFCYPYGKYDNRTASAVTSCGYQSATGGIGLNVIPSDPFFLKRMGDNGDRLAFLASISGALDACSKLKHRIRSARRFGNKCDTSD